MSPRSLRAGDRIPSFELTDQDDNRVRSDELLGSGPVVIYFYPRDNTPGCTAEACAFRDQFEAFVDAGARVVGISSDSAASHRGFAGKHRLPFTLLSDPGGVVSKMFGVGKHFGFVAGRETFIIDEGGIVVEHMRSLLNAKKHVQVARKVVETLVARSNVAG